MTDRQNGQRSHIVAEAVSRALAGRGIDDEGVTSDVMEALEELRIVSYQREDVLPLLTVAGRSLILILEHPDMTMREMAVRMGTVETNVHRSMTQLAASGLVSRYRVGRNNQYRVDWNAVLAHPDVWRFLAALGDEYEAMTNV